MNALHLKIHRKKFAVHVFFRNNFVIRRTEKLTSQYLRCAKSLRHNICSTNPFPDLPTELQKQEEKQKTFCYSEQRNKHKHLDSFWNNDSLIVIFSSFFLQEQAQTSENKCRTVFNTCKQTHMRIFELFLTMFNLAKNLMCASCRHPFNCYQRYFYKVTDPCITG